MNSLPRISQHQLFAEITREK